MARLNKVNTFTSLLFASVSLLMLTGCGAPEASQATTQQPQAISVDVAKVLYERITEWDEFTGRLQAPETVTLVPRVSGYVVKVNFIEGAMVEKGQLLFQIDPRPFAAEVERLKAQLQSAETAKRLANNDYQRANSLSKEQAISAEILDTRLANKQQAAATVASVKAALVKAELDLSFTQVVSPIKGKISNALITQGNYVNAGNSQLTKIVSTEKMHAYFDVDEQTYLNYVQTNKSDQTVTSVVNEQNDKMIYMSLANEQTFAHIGVIDFVDNQVNQQTGTIRLRASFDNPNGLLLPGLFTRLRLSSSSSYQGILIDDKAIGTDLSNKYVLVVNEQNQLEYRSVQLGEKIHGLRIITSGLTQGEQIVVNGLQRVRPNMPISPNVVDMTSAENLNALQERQSQLDQAQQVITAQQLAVAHRG